MILNVYLQPTREEGFIGTGGGTLSPLLTAGGTAGTSTGNTPSAQHPHQKMGKENLSESLKACNEILKELFSKKHSVRKYFLNIFL